MKREPARLSRLTTRRLHLLRPEMEDAVALRSLDRDPAVMATLGGMRGDAQIAADLATLRRDWSERGISWWIARERLSGRFVGRGGLRYVRLGEREELEVGYAVRSDRWGRGLASELTRASLWVAFTLLGRGDVVGFTLPGNRRSRRVLEKAGLHADGEVVHTGLPHVLYRLDAETWRNRASDAPVFPAATGPARSFATVRSLRRSMPTTGRDG